MTANELRQKYLEFFKSKEHAIIPSASLIPENDPSVLFTTAGMHPLVPYLMGEVHPLGKRLANAQKCVRTGDIDEVGDMTHHTFFEMLGNWSLGDYFKRESIEMSWEFLTSKEWLGLDPNRIAVSVFAGDLDAPFDQESFEIWKSLGMPESRIAELPKENNWWGMEKGPCGADTEIFYWTGDPEKIPDSFRDDNDQWVEIWNNVFMEFNKTESGKLEPLKQKNVDTGMGLERILAAMNNFPDNYQTDLFWPIIQRIEEVSGRKYEENEAVKVSMRIISDHLKASAFMIADGLEPSNLKAGYVLRRLIRRAIRQGQRLGMNEKFTVKIIKIIQDIYGNYYSEISNNRILDVIQEEENKFQKTLSRGMKKLFDLVGIVNFNENYTSNLRIGEIEIDLSKIDGKVLFDLFQTYGFPIELSIEEIERILRSKESLNENIKNRWIKDFSEEFQKHQELSRTASAGMFKGGLADSGDKTKQLHTVAHLMLAGLRKTLGEDVHQKGSNITEERIRFDFSYPDKMTDEQKKAVEDFVNSAIQAKVPVGMTEMTLDEAKTSGAEGAFENKYGERVKVYKIGEYSNEICGGPHVSNTSEIKGEFKIKKEQSSSSGVRRIKAVLE